MRKITCKFVGIDGNEIKKVAILNDYLEDISKSKANQCTDIIEYPEDGYWSIIFQEDDELLYEVEFELDEESYQKTLNPKKCVIWHNDVIDDIVKVTIKKKLKHD